jgi:PleD family two-component response regulator
MLDAYFRVQGYDVLVANWGLEGVERCQEKQPDLVILDIRLPDIDGYEVAKRLRENRKTSNIPIIFLTEKRNRSDRLQGLELGADDYITKPFDIQELRLRVRNALQRSTLGSISNPVTGLPEGSVVDSRLMDCLNIDSWAILLIALENLEFFREAYGFVACDDVLRAVSLMIQSAAKKLGNINDFIGQFSSSSFILITSVESFAKLEDQIGSRLEQSLDYFYPLRDRELPIQKNRRLAIKMGRLMPHHGPFRNLDDIKSTLMPKE